MISLDTSETPLPLYKFEYFIGFIFLRFLMEIGYTNLYVSKKINAYNRKFKKLMLFKLIKNI